MFAYSTIENVLFLNWRDCKHVMAASTLPHITNQVGVCRRRARGENGKYEIVTYPQPTLISEYTRNMNFVDRGCVYIGTIHYDQIIIIR